MAAANFDRALAEILKFEGGYVDHPHDPGGATNLGITIATLSDWLGRPATKAEVKTLTKVKVAPIYRARYWEVVRASQLPGGVDLATFDGAVNSGVGRGAKWLQGALGVAADGKVGPVTLKAAQAADPVATVKRLCAKRLGFLQGLKTFATFGKGWTRRVAHVEATAIAWAAAAAGRSTTETLAQEADAADAASRKASGGAAASGAGGGAAATQIDPSQADHVAVWIVVALVVAIVGVAGWLAWRAHVERQRMDALRALAGKREG